MVEGGIVWLRLTVGPLILSPRHHHQHHHHQHHHHHHQQQHHHLPDGPLVLSPRQHIEYVGDLGRPARQCDRRCNGDMFMNISHQDSAHSFLYLTVKGFMCGD